ncbi:Zinc-finger domain containing protein [Pandoravirus dulcis]|uniref:Zinc-finger domain containing protein n=1 Tax=Pandoravirus dulcis TaxID=1349409 RepID=S4VWS5_9VIRU|nr:Zinc-finger domain containing protein [Pandoravirus dulcis]AGO82501.1 Zinc-finger domain containing protein [Pandoravirus dulcis]
MQPHQPHERPTTAPLPDPKRQRVGDPTPPASTPAHDDGDDAAFWLAAVQETSAIAVRGPAQAVAPAVSRVVQPYSPAAAPRPTLPPHASRPRTCQFGVSAAPGAMHSATAPLGARSHTAPTVVKGVTTQPPRQASAAALPPPCLFGVSSVPRVRPPMAGADEPDDSHQRGGFSRAQRQPPTSPPALASSQFPQRQAQPPPLSSSMIAQRPPTLFTAAKPALPPPVIMPYVAPSPSSSSSSSSSSSHGRSDSQVRPGHETPIEGICCNCRGGTRETKTAVTKGGANAGRRYYVCLQRNQSGGCSFWLWHDEHGKARDAPTRDPRAPHYREHLAHDLLHASGGRTAERLVVLAREAAAAAAAGSAHRAETSPVTSALCGLEGVATACNDHKATADAWIEAVTDRWHVTRPVATDPSETDAAGAARRMPLVDLDLPMGDTARAACHPHTARQIACTALLAHMFALRGWRVVVQPPQMAFYQHVHLYIARGHYDKEAYWVRVEPAQRLDPRDPPDTPVQYESLWVQTAGPHPDSPGWLTGSHVDLVAFEGAEGFLLMDRRRLWRYIDRHVMRTPGKADDQTTATATAGPSEPAVVTDPAQADHRLLDMGALGLCPHERRTLLGLEALFQHDDVDRQRHRDAPAKSKVVIEETLFFDRAIAGPYLARMGRPALPAPDAPDPVQATESAVVAVAPQDDTGGTAAPQDGAGGTAAPQDSA